MNISKLMTDDAILAEIGNRIARYRIDQQVTQADLAEQAGVSKRTVERVEAGASVQFSTDHPDLAGPGFIAGTGSSDLRTTPRPMDLLKHKGKLRQRASSSQRSDKIPKKWSWGDES